MDCKHDITDRETACVADGLCPLCLTADLQETRAACAVMREALLRCQYGISEAVHNEAGLDGAEGQEIMRRIDGALSGASVSRFVERVKALEKVEEAAREAIGINRDGRAHFQPECEGSADDLFAALAVFDGGEK